jgi:hypothetical protein
MTAGVPTSLVSPTMLASLLSVRTARRPRMHIAPLVLTACIAQVSAVRLATADSILVYDHNTHHQLALQAAQSIPGTIVVRADRSTFDALLRSQTWDLVLADMPGFTPFAGLGTFAGYVNGGGKAAMSFWLWQDEPELSSAFGVLSVNSISLNQATLYDFATTNVFAGVTMPTSEWHDHWVDDGDVFSLTRGGLFLAGVAPDSSGVMALTNSGRTIAAPLFDEAGNTWLDDGSGVRLWRNMIDTLTGETLAPVPEPGTLTLLALGFGAAASRFKLPRKLQ